MTTFPNSPNAPHAGTPIWDSGTGGLSPKGYQQLSGSGVKTLTVPAGATIAILQAEAQAWRYRDDGTAPDASTGMPLIVGQRIVYGADLAAIKLIITTAGGIMNVLYYG